MRTKIVAAYTSSSRGVIGSHPENACMDNPNGFIWGTLHTVTCEAQDGRRWSHPHQFETAAAAEGFARKVQAVSNIDASLWETTYPVYGSPAWSGEECERRQALAFAVRHNDLEAIDRLA